MHEIIHKNQYYGYCCGLPVFPLDTLPCGGIVRSVLVSARREIVPYLATHARAYRLLEVRTTPSRAVQGENRLSARNSSRRDLRWRSTWRSMAWSSSDASCLWAKECWDRLKGRHTLHPIALHDSESDINRIHAGCRWCLVEVNHLFFYLHQQDQGVGTKKQNIALSASFRYVLEQEP